MNPYRLKNGLPAQTGFNIRFLIIIVSIFLLIFYGLFNARNLLLGPSIEIFSPISQETETRENTITIKGRASNMVFLSINERSIFVDTKGLFEEKLLLSPGFNIIEIKARDRFKKEILKKIKVYYTQSASSTAETLLKT